MARKDDRIVVEMACTECRNRNYVTTKNRRSDPDRMELRKFCRRCRSHHVHREAR